MPKKPPNDTTKKPPVKKNETKTTNEVKKQAVEKVKKSVPVPAKRASPDKLIDAVINHISGVVKEVKSIDDRKFSNVDEIIGTAISELEKDNKLGRQSPQAIKTRKLLDNVSFFLEDQVNAIDHLKKKF